MKKIYVNPAIEEFLVKTTVLMEPSLPTSEETVTSSDVLSRELFNDRLFDEE